MDGERTRRRLQCRACKHNPEPTTESHDLYSYRPPIDLYSARLRLLAAALSPAYVRIGGTWANSTFFSSADDSPATPPPGFGGVLTRRQWRDVVEFSRAVDARIVTSFAASAGTRDSNGAWAPELDRRLLAFTRSIGGRIAAAEFVNEPDLAIGLPDGYDAAAYERDFLQFHALMKQTTAHVLILGPGTVGDASSVSNFFAVAAEGIDAVSYHYYGALSERCAGGRTPDGALAEDWLSQAEKASASYRVLRDRLAPGKPIWLTETGEAACGGNRWSATFLDTFRYLDQLGRSAKAGVQVVMHNTLAASDYGLLDEMTFAPRPNYWAALLWRQLMGATVLESGVPKQQGIHVYAHCQRDTPGGVTLLVINNDRIAAHRFALPNVARRYTLDAERLHDVVIRLNGSALRLNAAGRLPHLAGIATRPGVLTFAPRSITFLTIPAAGNRACNTQQPHLRRAKTARYYHHARGAT
jgi:hypothetical protein